MSMRRLSALDLENRRVIETIRAIVERGNNAEIKRSRDGTLKVLEVKKHIAVG